MPSTGESPVIAAPGAATYETLLDALAAEPDLAPLLQLVAVGFSFGGHWAVRLALTHRRMRQHQRAPPPHLDHRQCQRRPTAHTRRPRGVEVDDLQPALADLADGGRADGNASARARASVSSSARCHRRRSRPVSGRVLRS